MKEEARRKRTRKSGSVEQSRRLGIRNSSARTLKSLFIALHKRTLELELIQTQMAQKPMLRAEVGMRVRCANKASAE